MPTLLQFGAGRIGRSFIAQLFSQSGFKVIFIDIDKTIIDELNKRNSYPVIIKADDGDQLINVKHVKGIVANDLDNVDKAIADADIAAISVGQRALPAVAKSIARGLLVRQTKSLNNPLDIILAENLRNANHVLKMLLKESLPADYPLDDLIGLVETSIGKMVPIMPEEAVNNDPLMVYAEPYNTLILDKQAFKNPIPDVKGLAPKENIKAWVDRKLFIHNLGHAATAYLGNEHHPSKKYIWEVLEYPEVKQTVRQAMLEAASVLMFNYPADFTRAGLEKHINDLLKRFSNKALGDTVYRVGCDLERKLGANDRLSAPIRIAIENNLPYSNMLSALISGFSFNAKDHNNKILEKDALFRERLQKKKENILDTVCGFDPLKHKDIFAAAEKIFRKPN